MRTNVCSRGAFAALAISLIFIMTALVFVPAPPLGDQPTHQSQAATAFVFAQEDDPVAEAGDNITAYSDEVVTFDGSNSTGFEGPDNLNYTWVVVYQSQTRVLYGATPSTTFTRWGVATVNLTVRDSLNRTDWDTSFVFVDPPPLTWMEKHLGQVILVAILAGILGPISYILVRRVVAGESAISEAEKEKFHLTTIRWKKIVRQLLHSPMGAIGIVILIFFLGMAVVGPMVSGDVKTIREQNDFLPPSSEHPLGTDNFGIDIFSQLLYGARTSIIVGVTSAIIASFLGAAVGLYSGYAGGWKDEAVMRMNDIVLSIPWLVLMIIVAALLGEIDLTGIIIIIGATGWSFTARMVRAQVLSIKERQYVERAKAIGASDMNIIRRHIFPNTFPLVFANTILTVAVSILSEATLSFLGLRPEGEVTWGTMLSYASESSAFQIGLHWWILAPGLCIVVVVLGFTLLGYALDEVLNPKLRHR
jgi:peptide/nickel transport system permease protein